jgi:hypothetical protein
MPKNKRPAPKKNNAPIEEKGEAVARLLCDLAIELVELEDLASVDEQAREKKAEFQKIIRKALSQKNDETLYDSLEQTRDADNHAFHFLKEQIEESAGSRVFKRDEGRVVEVNAFVIPLFIWSTGGLDMRASFQDQDAFDALVKSMKEQQLESPDAKVVLVNHAYHLDEIDRITFSHLHEMIHDAFASMNGKKLVATPAIESSMSGWPHNPFGPEDKAVELRFLLGFALKEVDDPFYRIPDDEAAADHYFDVRAERFERWAERTATTVKRCLVSDPAKIDVKFLYQDLFHGGKERGMAEFFMLQLMAELNQLIAQSGLAPDNLNAIIGPAKVADAVLLRVNLYTGPDDRLVASADKPCGVLDDVQVEFDDVCDALKTMGVTTLSVAASFDQNGRPHDVRPYESD